jgi:hypothetical protein
LKEARCAPIRLGQHRGLGRPEDGQRRIVGGQTIGEQVEKADGPGIQAVEGLERAAHPTAVGAPCRRSQDDPFAFLCREHMIAALFEMGPDWDLIGIAASRRRAERIACRRGHYER